MPYLPIQYFLFPRQNKRKMICYLLPYWKKKTNPRDHLRDATAIGNYIYKLFQVCYIEHEHISLLYSCYCYGKFNRMGNSCLFFVRNDIYLILVFPQYPLTPHAGHFIKYVTGTDCQFKNLRVNDIVVKHQKQFLCK